MVFSDDTLRGFMEADVSSYKRIVEQFAYRDKIETRIHSVKVLSGGLSERDLPDLVFTGMSNTGRGNS